jgi:hypothetical protein
MQTKKTTPWVMQFLHEDDLASALVKSEILQNRNVITGSEILRLESHPPKQ